VDPTQIQKIVDLPYQMIRWDHLIQIKRIKELTLTILPPTHHAPLPPMTPETNGITDRESSQREFCNRIASIADIANHEPIRRTYDRKSS
jgi:hypothetical protein